MEKSQKLIVECKIKSKMTVKCKMGIFLIGCKIKNTMRTVKYAVKCKMDILKTVKWKKCKTVKLPPIAPLLCTNKTGK